MLEKIAFFIILLGVLVLVHELGHFLVAKACKVQVFKFSIGFGPELLAWRLGETRYAISAVPLGGFVRMAGEDDLIERWGGPDAPPVDPERLLNVKPRWQRASIMAAGPLANLLLAFVLFSGAGYGDNDITPPLVQTVLPGSPAERAGLRSGDRILAVDGTAVTVFEDIAAVVGPRAGQTVQVLVRRDGAPQTIPLTLRSAAGQDKLQRTVEQGRMGVGAFMRKPVVDLVPGRSPARDAGVRALDLVLEVDGQRVERYEDLQRMLTARPDQPVELVLERRDYVAHGAFDLLLPRLVRLSLPPWSQPEPPLVPSAEVEALAAVKAAEVDPEQLAATVAAATGQLGGRELVLRGLSFGGRCVDTTLEASPATELGLKRGDAVLAVDGRAVDSFADLHEAFVHTDRVHTAVLSRGGELVTAAFRLQKRSELAPLKKGQDRHVFGALPPLVFVPGPTEVLHRGPLAALRHGFEQTASLTGLTAAGIGLLLTGQLPFTSVGGPMMLFDLAGRTSERGLSYFVFILAFISINLAVINLIPLPVLDGGHLLFLFIEALRRRPLDQKAREWANLAGLALLLLLMVAVMRNDILRYWDAIVGVF